MDPTVDDAYAILGVDSTATDGDIRKAYFKLARQHHPDKGGDRHVFARIGNAYELLSDPQSRRDYDASRRYSSPPPEGVGPGTGGTTKTKTSRNPRTTNQHHHHPHQHQHQQQYQQDDMFSHFHDPFDVFERFFQEFGGHPAPPPPFGRSQTTARSTMNPNDPFFGSGAMGGGMFGAPTMGGGGMFPPQDPFFGGGMMHPMMMDPTMMMRMGNGGGGGHPATSFVSTTSSSSSLGGAGPSISTSTRTRIVNGQRETVTERVVRHADGRVETHVERSTTGGGGSGTSSSRPQLSTTTTNTTTNTGTRNKLLSGKTRPRSTSGSASTNDPRIVVDLTQDTPSTTTPFISSTFTTTTSSSSTPTHNHRVRHQDKKSKRGTSTTMYGTK